MSTTGALAGIAAGTRDAQVVLMAGLVIIMVEALAMAAGQFLREWPSTSSTPPTTTIWSSTER